ncbi:hypothetical protein AB0B97_00655 [Micromonospora sp. NPDC049004]|uniref:hypothetical protein n=1 Tax=Micromonospora sp. NPDC049004 TaxID=3154348 RepID=UPI0033C50F97
MEPGEVRNELPPPENLALSQAWLWTKAVMVPAERLLHGPSAGLPDALLLLVALRNVHRAATMALRHMRNPDAKEHLTDAVAQFDAALPGLVQARDVVEHFDEYVLGDGNMQRRLKREAASNGDDLSEAELAERYAPRLRGTGRHPLISIGPHTIDVTRAPNAASWLLARIYSAADLEQRQPLELPRASRLVGREQ